MSFCPECGTLNADYVVGEDFLCPNGRCNHTGMPKLFIRLLNGDLVWSGIDPKWCVSRFEPPVLRKEGVLCSSEVEWLIKLHDDPNGRVVHKDTQEQHQGCEQWAMTSHEIEWDGG